MVVISLQSIFDLIKESQTSHPLLCLKVLKALLGILQNLLPESLKNEPPHVAGKVYKLTHFQNQKLFLFSIGNNNLYDTNLSIGRQNKFMYIFFL